MREKIKKNIITSLKLIISLGILFLLYFKLDLNVKSLFEIQDPTYLLMATILPLTIIPFLSINRWKLFLKCVDVHESFWNLVKINFVSLFQGIILPSSQGYDVLRIYHIEKRHPESRGKAGSTILIERMIGFVILCLLSLSFSFIIDIPNKHQVILIISLISIALFVLIFLLLNKHVQSFFSHREFKNDIIRKIYSYCDKFYSSVTYFPYKKVLFSSVLLICLFQLSTILSVYLIFRSYGVDIPFYTHVAIYPIISILSLIPITISGFGIREGFFVYFYSFLGVSPEICVAVSLMNYLVLTIEPAIIGFILYIFQIFSKHEH